MNRSASMLALALSVSAAACGGSLHDVVNAHKAGDGTERMYPIASDKAWDLAHEICRYYGAELFDDHKSEGYFLTQIDEQVGRFGAYMGVWLTPSGPDHTTVKIITRRTRALAAGKGLTEGTFQQQLAMRVEHPVTFAFGQDSADAGAEGGAQ